MSARKHYLELIVVAGHKRHLLQKEHEPVHARLAHCSGEGGGEREAVIRLFEITEDETPHAQTIA